jgi:hypothetical protein
VDINLAYVGDETPALSGIERLNGVEVSVGVNPPSGLAGKNPLA